ncbi:MAG: 2-amino-4-hydroxy-6-hydroxymethyldihydropteridine diphosphokinase [Gammaproteobacteria bacterium]|nr:2-amino-4-hydroxy-6-hydroxymethyldihydropteridine diphosphokinase [Gammaproteobacteria bacterium]
MSIAYVALGSNLDGPARHVRDAFSALDALPGTRLRRHSSLYSSQPLGPPGQPDYVNAVAELETSLEPQALLDGMQAIEQAHGRIHSLERWGPRPLDLDLLLFDDREIQDARLIVPHPEIGRRNFVLGPLIEVAPDARIPGMGSARDLLRQLGTAGLERLPDHGIEAA